MDIVNDEIILTRYLVVVFLLKRNITRVVTGVEYMLRAAVFLPLEDSCSRVCLQVFLKYCPTYRISASLNMQVHVKILSDLKFCQFDKFSLRICIFAYRQLRL